jgi:uncharacterized membrane protein
MAGIGFELQRALRGGSLVKAVTVALTGIVIVAGPWLISIIGISILTGTASFVLQEGQALFIGVIVYTYAFSICLFGGLHYIFTRYVSDLLFNKKYHRVTATLVLVSLGTALLSVIIAVPFALTLSSPQLSHGALFKIAVVILFVAINLIWIEMLVITILKGFFTIIGAYLAGMAVSVGGTVYFGGLYGLGGALLGFSLGQLAVALILLFIMLRWNFPSRPLYELKPLWNHARRYRSLMLSGWFYSAGLWIDKMVFWFTKGNSIGGTPIHLYQGYDYAAYIANLSVIPALVFFTIFTETSFFAGLRRFLLKLRTNIYTRIIEERYALVQNSGKIIGEQFYFHGLIALVLLVILQGFLVKVLVVAVFFHMAFLTFFTFLFYIESYDKALGGSVLFFCFNFAVTLASEYISWIPPGTGYLVGALVAGVYCGYHLYDNLNALDRIIFMRN